MEIKREYITKEKVFFTTFYVKRIIYEKKDGELKILKFFVDKLEYENYKKQILKLEENKTKK